MYTLPIYKGRKINRILFLIFLALFAVSLAAAFIVPVPFVILAMINGAFALLYGILWTVWAGREKKTEKAIRTAEEAHGGQSEPDGFFSKEYTVPKELLTEAAFRRLISISKGCIFASLGVFVFITALLIWQDVFEGLSHAAIIMLFSFAISIPGIMIQYVIYRRYEKSVPRKIGMYPGRLVIDDTVTATRDIREIRISPDRIFNTNSPSIFRKLTVSTPNGDRQWCIDYRSNAAPGNAICWNEYPEFASDLSEWAKTNNVQLTTEYME